MIFFFHNVMILEFRFYSQIYSNKWSHILLLAFFYKTTIKYILFDMLDF